MHEGWVSLWLGVALLALLPGSALATEEEFAVTSQDMVRGLTAPRYAKTRGFGSCQTRTIDIVTKTQHGIVQETVTVTEEDPTPRVNLKVEFDFDSYHVRPGSFPLISELAKAMKSPELRDKTVLIKGHTDTDGPEDYNLRLSLNRALAVKSVLVGQHSIPPDRLRTAGFGEGLPLAPNTTAMNKQRNRRVEVQVAQ